MEFLPFKPGPHNRLAFGGVWHPYPVPAEGDGSAEVRITGWIPFRVTGRDGVERVVDRAAFVATHVRLRDER
jgi:hypothetical protein